MSQQPDFVVNEVKDALPDPLEQYLPLTGGNLSGRLEIGSGGLQVAGGLTVLDSGLRVGDTAAEAEVAVQGTTSGSQRVTFQRGSTRYWSIGAVGSGSAPEFRVQRYVSGTYVDDPILVSHTTGKVSIQGQPAGRVFSQSTAPASPADGDLWVDTSGGEPFRAMAVASTGVSWNSVVEPGTYPYLMHGTENANGVGIAVYYYVTNYCYSTSGDLTQLIVPYTGGNGLYYRNRYSGTWSSWFSV